MAAILSGGGGGGGGGGGDELKTSSGWHQVKHQSSVFLALSGDYTCGPFY